MGRSGPVTVLRNDSGTGDAYHASATEWPCATGFLPFGAAIIDVHGRRADVEMEFTSKYEWDGTWSPDGMSILVTPDGADGKVVQQQLWDARSGKATQAPWTGTSFPAWQRVAP